MRDDMDATAQLDGGKYPIRVISRLTGIPIDTLRAWERRYGAVVPGRDDRGRLYGDGDLERLKLLRRLVERGHAIGRVARLATPDLERLLEAALEPRDRGQRADAVDVGAIVDAFDRYDAAEADRLLGRLAAVLSARELVHDVVLPVMREVGRAWHDGRFTVAQEHLASAAMRSLLGALVRVQAPRDGRAVLVFATPSGERHELGVLAAAMLATASGLGVVYLGADLPPEDVAQAARRTGARAVVLGLTGADDAPGLLEGALAVVAALPRSVEVLVGGEAALRHEERLRVAGAAVMRDLDALEDAYRALGARS